MKNLSNNSLQELLCLLNRISNLCTRDFLHVNEYEAVQRIIKIADSHYQKIDNVLNERYEAAENE